MLNNVIMIYDQHGVKRGEVDAYLYNDMIECFVEAKKWVPSLQVTKVPLYMYSCGLTF